MRRNITDNPRTITLLIAFTATNRYPKHIPNNISMAFDFKKNIDFLQRGLNSQFTLSIGFFNTMASLDVVL
jgi:hypothetical protein